jgi:hypothetical protein
MTDSEIFPGGKVPPVSRKLSKSGDADGFGPMPWLLFLFGFLQNGE